MYNVKGIAENMTYIQKRIKNMHISITKSENV